MAHAIALLLLAAAAAAAPVLPALPCLPFAPTDWKGVKADILALIGAPNSLNEKAPTLVRLAWHASCTYSPRAGGGSGGGTIRTAAELGQKENAGLAPAIGWLRPIQAKHCGASWGDLVTFAAVTSVEAMGGPKVAWRAGRVDSDAIPPDGRLPGADPDGGNPAAAASAARGVFRRLGLSDREAVALIGAHSVGRMHREASGYEGEWTHTSLAFTNGFFVLLAKVPYHANYSTPKFQFTDPARSATMLPSDIGLTKDASFNVYVQEFANDQDAFFAAFASAYAKLLELGTKNLRTVSY